VKIEVLLRRVRYTFRGGHPKLVKNVDPGGIMESSETTRPHKRNFGGCVPRNSFVVSSRNPLASDILGMQKFRKMALEKELALFAKMKPELLKSYDGKFALIRGEEFLGAYDSAENAYAEGVRRFGRETFLVKKVVAEEDVYRNQALSLGLMHARL